MVKLSINLGHCIQFQDTSIPATRSEHMEHVIREARKIELHPNNMNREGFSLGKSWKQTLKELKKKKGPLL
jgi:hypothetical protein